MLHGMSKEFVRRFRDALLIIDKEDRAKVEAYLNSRNATWNEMMLKNSDWILERVRRYVPQPDFFLPLVRILFDKMGNSVYAM
ncbi:unnamed protein product [Mucor hiemalis]